MAIVPYFHSALATPTLQTISEVHSALKSSVRQVDFFRKIFEGTQSVLKQNMFVSHVSGGEGGGLIQMAILPQKVSLKMCLLCTLLSTCSITRWSP